MDEEGSERKPADDEREVQLTRPKHGQTSYWRLERYAYSQSTNRRTSGLWLLIRLSRTTAVDPSSRMLFPATWSDYQTTGYS